MIFYLLCEYLILIYLLFFFHSLLETRLEKPQQSPKSFASGERIEVQRSAQFVVPVRPLLKEIYTGYGHQRWWSVQLSRTPPDEQRTLAKVPGEHVGWSRSVYVCFVRCSEV